MSSSIPTVLTKPRKAQLLLEGTAVLVASTLLIWIFLWFLNQVPQRSTVKAYFVEPTKGLFVPYQEADAQALSADKEVNLGANGLKSKVTNDLLSARSPTVFWISAPVSPRAELTEEKAKDLIETIIKTAQHDVLIILDMCQIDSDRELGIFGNAPYRSLREPLEKGTQKKPGVNIFALLSSEPGQKSWMIDGLGRSTFSYFVQKGLMMDEVTKNRREGKTSSLERFAQYVRNNTSEWVRIHRGNAIQTPVLIQVGESSKSEFKFPTLGRNPAKPVELAAKTTDKPAASKEPGPATEAQGKMEVAKEKTDAGTISRENLVKLMIDEWESYDKLGGQKVVTEPLEYLPSRYAPARLRLYESSLLTAERLMRAAWNDEKLLKKAADAISSARDRGVKLREMLVEAKKEDDDFPIQPARDGNIAEKNVNDCLKYVTGQVHPEIAWGSAASPLVEGSGGGTGKLLAGDKSKEQQRPSDLDFSFPRTKYLEVQLPAWADKFRRIFEVAPFADTRGELLREAVFRRFPAETALALDRRGLTWIEQEIRKGDELRRSVQDDLFTVVEREKTLERILEYGKKYDMTLDRIKQFREARTLFESIASQLPYYEDWKVFRSSESQDLGGESVPSNEPDTTTQTDTTSTQNRLSKRTDWDQYSRLHLPYAALRDALEQQPPLDFQEMSEVIDQAKSAFALLKSEFDKSVRDLRDDLGVTWRKLDDALMVPMIPASVRKELLRKVVEMENNPPAEAFSPTNSSDDSSKPTGDGGLNPMDRSFEQKALGLASLDFALRRLGSGREAMSVGLDKSGDLAKLIQKVAQELPNADEKNFRDVLTSFSTLSQKFQILSKSVDDRSANSWREAADSAQSMGELRAFDRKVRFRTVDEINRSGIDPDQAARDLEATSRWATLRFHAERLAEDFDSENANFLREKLDTRAKIPGMPSIAISVGRLAPQINPNLVSIRSPDNKAEFTVGVRSESMKSGREIPRGRAFVGVSIPKAEIDPTAGPAATPPKESARLEVSSKPGFEGNFRVSPQLAGGLYPIGLDANPAPLTFLVEQITTSDRSDLRKHLNVTTFYRNQVAADYKKNQLVVECRQFGDPIEVVISQDLEKVKDSYPASVAGAVTDQFLEHPRVGYLHYKGRIDYVLTFRNTYNKQLDVVIEQSWKTGADDPGKPAKLIPITLMPGESYPIKGKLLANEVPIDGGKQLIINVVDKMKQPQIAQPVTFQFKQLELEKYIDIQPKRERYDFDDDGTLDDCFRITVSRRQDDPVTLPILWKDVTFSIDDQPPTNKVDQDKYLHRGQFNNELPCIYLITSTMKSIKWRVVIEGEGRGGDFPVPRN